MTKFDSVPFDLGKAMQGLSVITRYGARVEVLEFDPSHTRPLKCGIFAHKIGCETIPARTVNYYSDGRKFTNGPDTRVDLFMEPVMKPAEQEFPCVAGKSGSLKKFNLNKALAGDPVQTLSGCKIVKLCWFPEISGPHKLLAIIEMPETALSSTRTGQAWFSADGVSSPQSAAQITLKMVAVKKTVWVNLHKTATQTVDGRNYTGGLVFDTEEQARKHNTCSFATYVGTYPIEIED